MALLNSMLEKWLATQNHDATFWIGFSGGIDSLVLLHALVNLRKNFPLKLRAIHINHNLQNISHEWQKQCEEICKVWQVDFLAQSVQLNTTTNLEEAARNARYDIFASLLQENDVLLTGHHQDDQAETVLLQLLRGAGPKGLSAMPTEKKLGVGRLSRPLLNITRAEIQEYALQHNLKWIDDPSNLKSNLTRNFFRNDIVPVLKTRWPNVSEVLSRVAENCQETQAIITEIAKQDLTNIKGSQPDTLSLQKLARLSPERQRQALRTWFHELGYPVPNQKKLMQLQHDFLNAATDRFPHVSWGNVELRRFNDELYIMPNLAEFDTSQVHAWDLMTPLTIHNIQLNAISVAGKGLRQNLKNITVRFRQGGEVCKLQGKGFTQELKKIFQEKNIPTWQRSRIPLIYVEDKLAAAANYFLVDEFAAESHEQGWEIVYHYHK